MSPRVAWRTGPNETWVARNGVTCRGCRLGEFYGVPKHEPSCVEQKTWYCTPGDTPAWARALCDALDDGPRERSPAEYEDRRRLLALNWLVRALHHASVDNATRFDLR